MEDIDELPEEKAEGRKGARGGMICCHGCIDNGVQFWMETL